MTKNRGRENMVDQVGEGVVDVRTRARIAQHYLRSVTEEGRVPCRPLVTAGVQQNPFSPPSFSVPVGNASFSTLEIVGKISENSRRTAGK